jgi:putative toxin-antitoxin system antitoxin component (TIGR02293 family)
MPTLKVKPSVAEKADWKVAVRGQTVMSATLGQLTASKTVRDPIEVLETGLPKESFERLREAFGIPKHQLAEIVSIPVRTLTRRKRLLMPESDRVLRLGLLFQKSVQVFGNADASRQWMLAPKRAFSGRTPLEMARTEIGAREVERLLGQIEHGVFA